MAQLPAAPSYRRTRILSTALEQLESRTHFSSSALSASYNPYTQPPAGSKVTVNNHTWTATATGLYHTNTDLVKEWKNLLAIAQTDKISTLTPVQRLEANAEVVFENTGLKDRSKKQQQLDREDLQKEFDAIAQALTQLQSKYKFDPTKPLTEQGYMDVSAIIRSDSTLYELGLQGHGLNNPPASRYRGYTNNIQNNVDNCTLYIGGGLDNNEGALPDFLDDVVMSHLPFPVVFQDGSLQQLNQNADAEDEILDAVVAFDDVAYNRLLKPTDFSDTASDANNGYVSPLYDTIKASAVDLSAGPVNGTLHSLLGDVPLTLNRPELPHTWTAGADGLFHTTDLSQEWHSYYVTMQSGDYGSLTPIQKLEGNAEAVFQNTNITYADTAAQQTYREDAQRQFDAIAAAMKINQSKFGTKLSRVFNAKSYIQLENTVQSDPALLELSLQGHGLNNAPNPRYNGYTNDFQNNVDPDTNYIGGGLNSGKNALEDFFDDNIVSHAAFPVVYQDGRLVQLNQNGNAENSFKQSLLAANQTMFYRVYNVADFNFAGAQPTDSLFN
jgi:hypothetical protein